MSTRADVLVTGAAGFVGEALVRRLGEAGRRVVGADLRGEAGIVHVDVTDAAAIDALIERHRPHQVVHAAAIVDDRVPAGPTFAVNVRGTEHVLRACERHHVTRLVHVSSIAALGYDPGEDADARSPLVTTTGTPYFDTKARSEQIIRDAMRHRSLELVVARPGDVYGPGSDPWVRRPLEMIRRNVPLLIGGGEGLMAHCWIDNLVDGLVACLDHPAAPGGIFTFHDGARTTYREYLTRLARAAGLSPPKASLPTGLALAAVRLMNALSEASGGRVEAPMAVGAVRYLTRRSTYSLRESREVLGWSPAIDLDGAMRALAPDLAR